MWTAQKLLCGSEMERKLLSIRKRPMNLLSILILSSCSSFDAVSLRSAPNHWQDKKSSVAMRSKFLKDYLRIMRVTREDAGLYKCRVDYKLEQTTFQSVNLTVVELGSQPVIYHEGEKIKRWVEAKEGEEFSLECRSKGGNPSPRVTWWRGKDLLDETFYR